MQNMEIKVYVSETVRVAWEVQMQGRRYSGKEDTRRTIVAIIGNVLEVYLAAQDLNSETGAVQLAGEISALFDINPKHNLLILYILSVDKPEAIERYLVEQGIKIASDASVITKGLYLGDQH